MDIQRTYRDSSIAPMAEEPTSLKKYMHRRSFVFSSVLHHVYLLSARIHLRFMHYGTRARGLYYLINTLKKYVKCYVFRNPVVVFSSLFHHMRLSLSNSKRSP